MPVIDKYKFNRYIATPKRLDNSELITYVGLFIVVVYFLLRTFRYSHLPIYFIDGLVLCIAVAYFFNRDKVKKQSLYKHEPLHGDLVYDLVFTNDYIKVEQIEYPLDLIYEVKFVEHEDFYGALKYKKGHFEGALSQGVYNFLVLNLRNGKDVQCQFQQKSRHELRNIRPMLEKYYENGIIGFNHLVEILRIESMNEREILRVDLERRTKNIK